MLSQRRDAMPLPRGWMIVALVCGVHVTSACGNVVVESGAGSGGASSGAQGGSGAGPSMVPSVPADSACAPRADCEKACAAGAFDCASSPSCPATCQAALVAAGGCHLELILYVGCAAALPASDCAATPCASEWDGYQTCLATNQGPEGGCSYFEDDRCCCTGTWDGGRHTEDCDSTGACACYRDGQPVGTCQEASPGDFTKYTCAAYEGCCMAFF